MNNKISGIRYYSFGGSSGYGQSAQAYMRGLLHLGYDISWHPLTWRVSKYVPLEDHEVEEWRDNETVIQPELVSMLHRNIEYSHTIMHVIPEYWDNLIESDKTNIGYTTWEADKLPYHWPEMLELADLVLVPSKFNQRVFQAELPNTNVAVIPHIIEEHIPSPKQAQENLRKKYNIEPAEHIFYTINTWMVRKNLASLLHAYLLAFTADESVCLVVKTNQHGSRSRLSNKYENVPDLVTDILANYADPAKVVVIADDDISNEEITALHDIGDCYISLSYGEGWGMGAAEAASAGNPVLITGWSGHLDFLGNNNPGLIDYELTPVIDRLGRSSHSPHQSWAKADLNDAIDKLISYADKPETWQAHAKQHLTKLQKFSRDNVTRQFSAAISKVNNDD